MSKYKDTLTEHDIKQAELPGWLHVGDTFQATFDSGDFATGLRFVNLIGESAEKANHHPDIVLTYPTVSITLTSHDVGGLSLRDVDLAHKINAHAEGIGITTTKG